MTSLDFLFIALGGGFLILVVFLSVMLLNLAIVLKDVSKMSGNLKDVSERIRNIVMEPVKSISEMTAGIGFVKNLTDRLKARFEDKEAGDCGECCECEDGDCPECDGKDCVCPKEGESPKTEEKKKGFFSVKKLRK